MKKDILIFCTFLLLALLTTGCSSDNDDLNSGNGEVSTINENLMLLKADLLLLNSEGKETTVFSYGENITFDVKVSNSGEKAVTIQSEGKLLNNANYRVYTKNGIDMGCPWDMFLTHALWPSSPCSINPNESKDWTCLWKGLVYSDATGIQAETADEGSIKFVQLEERDNLPRGEYYCQVEVALSDNDIRVCSQDFIIE